MAKKRREDATIDSSEDSTESEKVKFLVWFTGALDRYREVKPHHMGPLQAFFRETGIAEPNTKDAFDAGLRQFGYKG